MFSGGRVLEGPRFPQVPLFCRFWPFSSFFLPFAGSGGFLLRAVSGDRLRLKEFDIAEVLCLCFGVIVQNRPHPSLILRAPSTHRLSNARPPSPLEIAGGILISIMPQKVPTRDPDPLCLPDYPAFTVRPYGFSVNTVYSFAFHVFPARVYIFSRAREVRRPWTPGDSQLSTVISGPGARTPGTPGQQQIYTFMFTPGMLLLHFKMFGGSPATRWLWGSAVRPRRPATEPMIN